MITLLAEAGWPAAALAEAGLWSRIMVGEWWVALLGIFIVCFVIINFIAVYAGVNTLLERKIAAHMQARVGPYQVGPHGSLQWLADALKLMVKEDVIPRDTDRLLFRLAPFVVFGGSFAAWVALPFTTGWSPPVRHGLIVSFLPLSTAVVFVSLQ